MSTTHPIWHGAVAISSSPCDRCGKRDPLLFQLDERGWECRACVLDPARGVGVIDRRGDMLRTPEQIAHELDLRAAIALHLESRDRANSPDDWGPLPESTSLSADYVQVLAVLGRLARADDQCGDAIAELRERYEAA